MGTLKERIYVIQDRAYMRAAEVAYRGENASLDACMRNEEIYSRLHSYTKSLQ
jgi:hypothetical protein